MLRALLSQYETASKRFFEGQNVPVLSYLSRAWFAKANKIGSFTAMRQALKHSQMVSPCKQTSSVRSF